MSESLTTSFEIASWDESPFDEGEGLGKLTRASVGRAYSGDIDGESVTCLLYTSPSPRDTERSRMPSSA